jgi:thioredoxin-dependent peroxiredoxin
MATIQLKGNPIETVGVLPLAGAQAPAFTLVKTDLGELTLDSLKGKRVVLNVFPSLDTAVCATSVRRFNQLASGLDNTVVVCVSKDLPFAHNRFCSTEGLDKVVSASDFREGSFGKDYGLTIESGPLRGLHSRAVVVLDENSNVLYSEQVPEIVQEPDYDKAISFLK